MSRAAKQARHSRAATSVLCESEDFLKPANDVKDYRLIELPNELRVLLISDPRIAAQPQVGGEEEDGEEESGEEESGEEEEEESDGEKGRKDGAEEEVQPVRNLTRRRAIGAAVPGVLKPEAAASAVAELRERAALPIHLAAGVFLARVPCPLSQSSHHSSARRLSHGLAARIGQLLLVSGARDDARRTVGGGRPVPRPGTSDSAIVGARGQVSATCGQYCGPDAIEGDRGRYSG